MEHQQVGYSVTEKLARYASLKAARRLIPFLILCFLVNWLDRNSMGFAALTMNQELGFTAEMYGFGAGIFFFGYILFEVPSNLILEKVGASLWFARIMISWGVIASSFAFVPSISGMLQNVGFTFFDNARTFYLLRFIFGVAEAGAYPGIVLYLTYWFPADERARWFGVFNASVPLSVIIAGLISGFILDAFDGYISLSGWKWLFIIEGVPSVIVGIWALWYLTDKPTKASWLEPDERIALQAKIDHERKSREAIHHYKLREALTDPRVIGLGLVWIGVTSGLYGLVYWLPQIIKGMATDIGLDKLTGISINVLTGYLVAIPFGFAIISMIWWGRHSDITRERIWHVAGPTIVSGLALISAAYVSNPVLAFTALTISAIGIEMVAVIFYTLPAGFLTGYAAAGGIALINSIGNISGFVGPYTIGWVKETTGESTLGFVVLALFQITAGLAVLLMGHDSRMEMAGSHKT